MRALVIDSPGPHSRLVMADVPAPALGPGQLRIGVSHTAVNRADLLQRRGLYPPPFGASDVLGLECAGVVLEVGEGVAGWSVGAPAMALLPGGGYAEQVVVDAGSVLPIPPALGREEAGGFMETFVTAYLNVFELGSPPPGGAVLVHGGSGGVGTSAIALGREAGLEVIVTAGSPERCARCVALGAAAAIDYRADDFARALAESGVDVVLDCVGAPYLEKNLSVLRTGGALVLIGLMGGATAELKLAPLLTRRLRVIGSTLRGRSVDEKAALIDRFAARFGEALAGGRLRPVIDRVVPLDHAEDAHAALAAREVFGKIVLRIGGLP